MPAVNEAIERIGFGGALSAANLARLQVVQFISGRPGAAPVDFVGIDNDAAGPTAGRFSGGRQGKAPVISETMQARDSLERRSGFGRVLPRDFPALSALSSLEAYGDEARTRQIIGATIASHRDILGAYALGSEALADVCDVADRIILAQTRTSFTGAMLASGALDAVIAQNPGHLVRSAIRLLRARCDGRAPPASQDLIRIEILINENLGADDVERPAPPGG